MPPDPAAGEAAVPEPPAGAPAVRLVGLELVRVALPLISPWVTEAGVFSCRDSLLVRAVIRGRDGNGCAVDAEGWGECGALPDPTYSSEYTQAAVEVCQRYLVPALLGAQVAEPAAVGAALGRTRGHHMAKAALEGAVTDAYLRLELGGQPSSMAGYFASISQDPRPTQHSVTAGVAVGLANSLSELVEEVARHVGAGYSRVKLKVKPGWDYAPLSALRGWPSLVLFADANGAYEGLLAEEVAAHLRPLDQLGLVCLEQPLGVDDLAGHARLAAQVEVPICLDEPLTSYEAVMAALQMGACSVVNIKAGRLGGYQEAVRAHDLCASRGVPVWCGGMVETGVARAANVAMAALPGFSLPGDLSATGRFFAEDLTSPLALEADGTVRVPTGPGSGVVVDGDAVSRFCTWRDWSRAG